MNGDLGISLSLPLGTSNQLEEKRAEILGRAAASAWDQEEDHHHQHQQSQEEEEQSKPLSGDSFHEDHDHDDRMSDNGGIDDEDRVIMPFHHDEQQRDIRNNDDDDDDDDDDNDDEEGGSIRSSSDGDDDEDEDDDDNLDDLSLTPPPTMPVLSLDLEKLCGYPPKNQEECQRITTEIRAALLGVVVVVGGGNGNGKDQKYDDDDDDDGKSKGAQDETSLDFIARSNELFEAGIARHCSTDNSHDIIDYEHSNESNNEHNNDNHEDPRAIVPYPEFLPLPPNDPSSTSTSTSTSTATAPSTTTTSTSTLLSTQRIWKKIIHPHSTPIVQNLLHLLSRCNRTLIWKYQMMHEIRRIASFQSACKNRRVQRELVRVWRRETRPAELAKLYDVRETFVIRLDGARGKLRGFEEEREVRVQRELRRRVEFGQNGNGHGHGHGHGSGKSTGGIAGLDWDTNVTFGFGEDVEDVVQKLLEERRRAGNGNGDGNGDVGSDKEYNSFAEDEFDDLDDDDADDDDSEFSDDDNGNVETEASRAAAAAIATPEIEIPLPITSITDRKKRRAAAAAKRLRKRLHTQQEKSLEHELRGKIERAYAEEEAVRHMLLSTDERMALSTVFHLEKQLEKVDELLESLQEEEWKDEEEGLLEEGGDDEDENEDEDGVGSADATEDDHGDSVLHQILAMILGAMPDDGSGSSSSSPSREEHFSFLKKEHTTIVEGWKKEFGRLPQLNDDDDNDNDDDEATDGSMGKATNDGDSAALPGRTGYTAEDPGTDMMGATPWDEGEEYLDSKMKGMSLSKSAASQPAVQSGIAPNTMSIFGPTSVPDDWEDAADDDGFEELFRPPEAPIKGDSLDTTSSPSVGAARPRAGLRPGGRIK